MLGALSPVNRQGSYQGETKCIPTTSKHSDLLLDADSTLEDWKKLGENAAE